MTLKHCWIRDRHGRLPALLIGWRNISGQPGGWEGRVVHAVLTDGVWELIEEWLPAAMPESA